MTHFKYIKKAAALLLSLTLTVLTGFVTYAEITESSRYVGTIYNEQNGLPTSEANVVLQTSDGYIWIGSYGGLIRYDGTDFRNYSLEGSIDTSSIRSLYEDSAGRLWIGTNDMGAVMYRNDQFTEIHGNSRDSFLCIRDFTEAADGTIYAASSSGIAMIDEDGIHPFDTDSLIGETVYTIAIDSRDRIWATMSSGRCLILDRNGSILKELKYSDVKLDSDIYSVRNGADGEIYIGSLQSTLSKIKFPTDSTDPAEFDITTYSTGQVSTHNHINVTDSGEVLISGLYGIGVLSPDGSFREFGESDNAMSVNCTIKDYEGSYWLASSSYGIIKLSVGCFDTSNTVSGLGEVSVNAISRSGGMYYIGTDTGLHVFDSSWRPVSNELTETLNGIRIRDILSDSKGNVWFAVYSDYAVLCYDTSDGDITTYGESSGFISNRGRTLTELSDGSIAAGTQHGAAIIRDGKMTASYGTANGIENPYILCLLEGRDGTLYAGSDGNGIYAIKDGTVTNHSFEEGLEEGVVLRMINDSDNERIFISAGSSLYSWEDGIFTKLDTFSRGAGSFFDLYDRNGKLWLMQNGGILSVDKESILAGKNTESILYSFQHGLTGPLNANTWNYLSDDGTLYLSTRNGISMFAFRGVENMIPQGIINSVTIDGMVYEHPRSLEIPKNAGRITIDLAALTYTDTTPLNISYYLEGFDGKETLLSDSKSLSVSYTNLPGGRYTFKARIFDPEDVSRCETVQLTLTKQRRLVEEPLFWIILAAALILLTIGVTLIVNRVKINKIKQHRDEYRQIVNNALETFARTIDAKDKYTNGHSIRVAEYSREIARRMKMNEQEQERIYYIALLHDIGKIGIPDHILNKPGKLTDEEREIIQTHPAIGGDILKDFNALDGITDGARYHHERYDGKGYCERKRGEQIPLVARIIGVADTYDAMSSDRCYRKALSKEVIIDELKNGTGTQFDPTVVGYMLEMIEEGIVPTDTDR